MTQVQTNPKFHEKQTIRHHAPFEKGVLRLALIEAIRYRNGVWEYYCREGDLEFWVTEPEIKE
jgi:hypothetical protein